MVTKKRCRSVRNTERNRESYRGLNGKIYLIDIRDETGEVLGGHEKSEAKGEQRRDAKGYFPIVDSDQV